jgi:hypothetical protein
MDASKRLFATFYMLNLIKGLVSTRAIGNYVVPFENLGGWASLELGFKPMHYVPSGW